MKLKCNSSNYQCGGKCQRKTNFCRKSLDKDSSNNMTGLSELIQALAEEEERDNSRNPSAIPDNDFTKEWGFSWDKKMPRDLQDAIDLTEKPNESKQKSRTSFYSYQYKEISIKGERTDYTSAASYRHEYGHHLDEMYKDRKMARDLYLEEKTLSSALRNIAKEEDIAKKDMLSEDFDERFSEYMGRDVTISAFRQRKTGREYIAPSSIEVVMESKNLSGTKEFDKAMKTDLNRILDRTGNMSTSDIKDGELISPKAKRQQYIDGISSYYPELKTDIEDAIGKIPSKRFDLLNTILYSPSGENDATFVASAVISEAYGKSMSNGLDLIGSISKNRLGKGHSDKYYERSRTTTHEEVVANLVDMYSNSGRNSQVKNFLEVVTPDTLSTLKSALKIMGE